MLVMYLKISIFMIPDFIKMLMQDVGNIVSYCRQITALLNHILNMNDAWKTNSGQYA